MEPLTTIATIDDLVVGLLLGAAIGLLAGPLLRSRIAFREWTEVRREAALTDELLARLEDMDLDAVGGVDDLLVPGTDGVAAAPDGTARWRTSH